MKTELIKETLNKYIDSDLYDVEGLFDAIKYQAKVDLSIISNYANKVNVPFLKRKYGIRENPYFALTAVLGDEEVDIDTFIKRVPFFFYIYSNKERELSSSFHLLFSSFLDVSEDEDKFYSNLEEFYYSHHFSLETIFGYVLNQLGSLDDFNNYFKWIDYVSLVKKSGGADYEPKNLLWSYNKLLIETKQEPLRYSIDFWNRTDREIVVSGNLPFNPKTNDLEMSWILLWVNNASSIKAVPNDRNDLRVDIHIALEPNTFIYQFIDGVWNQLYVGPNEMYFDLEAIKQRRKQFGYNQEEVADIIGVSLRSYKYFEQGKIVPNGLQLIRLMNLLNFYDVDAFIYRENIEDKDLSKFLSGKVISTYLKRGRDE